jgi:predicted kinase
VAARAEKLGVPVCFVETRCAPELARARLAERRLAGRDASDAGPELQAASRAGFEPLEEWPAALLAALDTGDPGWRAGLDAIAERVQGLRSARAAK